MFKKLGKMSRILNTKVDHIRYVFEGLGKISRITNTKTDHFHIFIFKRVYSPKIDEQTDIEILANFDR